MKARIRAIPTVYGIGCAGLQCGGGLGQDLGEEDQSYNTTPDNSILAPTYSVGDTTDMTGLTTSTGDVCTNASCTSTTTPSIWNTISTTNGTTSTPTTSLTSAIASISSAFTNIFKAIQPLPAGCTQVAGPYGTSTQCVNATTTQSLLSLSSLGSSNTLLLIGGVALVGVFLLMGAKK